MTQQFRSFEEICSIKGLQKIGVRANGSYSLEFFVYYSRAVSDLEFFKFITNTKHIVVYLCSMVDSFVNPDET